MVLNADINNDFWKDRKVFVTGSTGFLGSWITKYLVDSKADVVCLIRDNVPESNFYRNNLKKRVKIIKGDLNDFDTLNRTINEYEIENVFHVGAQTIVGIANRNPMPTLKTNILGTINILESCRINPTVKGIIVASSDKAYGSSKELPYDEETPLRGEYPYDVSKSCKDLLSRMYFKTYGLPVCVTRCGNLFGGGDLNFNRIVPGMIKQIYQNQSPKIRSDGKFVREYLYVKDASEAYINLAEKMDNNKSILGEAFNFGTDEKLSVLELVDKIIKVMKSDLKPIILNEIKNEIVSQCLSSEKAKRILGWKSKYTIDQGLIETVNWYKEFFKDKNAI